MRARELPRLFTLCTVLAMVGCGGSTAKAPKSAATTKSERPKDAPVADPIDPGRIVFAMRGYEVGFRKCFFKSPRTPAKVKITWGIDRLGVSSGASVVSSSSNEPLVEECLVERVNELRFGELAMPASAEWTFVFRLANPAPEKQKAKRAKRRRSRGAKQRPEREAREPVEGTRILSGSGVEAEDVDGTIQAGARLFVRCYRDGVGRHERLVGTVRLRFQIGQQGRMTKIEDAGSELSDLFALDCVAESLYALKFKKPNVAPVQVLYGLQVN
ncbi:MAG TPA: AgmX/PglI C-terminal domain-containing protein [Polyangiaceae bacterium]|nr:AgmX/PglI C-terminal domain-containing protein [Polyangiaceae bacterium]